MGGGGIGPIILSGNPFGVKKDLPRELARDEEFRLDAQKLQLISSDLSSQKAGDFLLELNSGNVLLTSPDFEKLYLTIKCARQLAQTQDCGEHVAILNLSVDKRILENPGGRIITFIDESYVRDDEKSNFISVRDLLAVKGYDLSDEAIKSL